MREYFVHYFFDQIRFRESFLALVTVSTRVLLMFSSLLLIKIYIRLYIWDGAKAWSGFKIQTVSRRKYCKQKLGTSFLTTKCFEYRFWFFLFLQATFCPANNSYFRFFFLRFVLGLCASIKIQFLFKQDCNEQFERATTSAQSVKRLCYICSA